MRHTDGRKIEGPNEEVIVIPRPSGPVVFTARAVLDYGEFNSICPKPVAKTLMVQRPGQDGPEPQINSSDPTFRETLNDWAKSKTAYMLVKSLSGPDNPLFDLVSLDKPETWGLLEKEFEEAGFTNSESARILGGVLTANGLDAEKYREAKEHFLATREALKSK